MVQLAQEVLPEPQDSMLEQVRQVSQWPMHKSLSLQEQPFAAAMAGRPGLAAMVVQAVQVVQVAMAVTVGQAVTEAQAEMVLAALATRTSTAPIAAVTEVTAALVDLAEAGATAVLAAQAAPAAMAVWAEMPGSAVQVSPVMGFVSKTPEPSLVAVAE